MLQIRNLQLALGLQEFADEGRRAVVLLERVADILERRPLDRAVANQHVGDEHR